MYLIPEARVPDHIGSRIANTGASFAVAVAYLLFALMLLTMVGEIFVLIMGAYS
jgi:hypothetical protein